MSRPTSTSPLPRGSQSAHGHGHSGSNQYAASSHGHGSYAQSTYSGYTAPLPAHSQYAFCNSFWGMGDEGVGVLFGKMKGSLKTMEELRAFWKERAAIEEDYAKRLNKLARPIGQSESGDLRNCIDILVLETASTAKTHSRLSHTLTSELATKTSALVDDLQKFRKSTLVPIEKLHKEKVLAKGHLDRAKERYEGDLVKINAYTAQSTLVQGRDLDKVLLKLERTKQGLGGARREYEGFVRVYGERLAEWEARWRSVCDGCEEVEGERGEFVKEVMWAYANLGSAAAVGDDNSCEKMRIALEDTDIDRDVENFVRDNATGRVIPDVPVIPDYTTGPTEEEEMQYHLADFTRTRRREGGAKKWSVVDRLSEEEVALDRSVSPVKAEEPEEDDGENRAGVGAGGGSPVKTEPPPVTVSRRSTTVTRKPVEKDIKLEGSNNDPLAQTLEALTKEVSTAGSVRRKSVYRAQSPQRGRSLSPVKPSLPPRQTGSVDLRPQLSQQHSRSVSPGRDYRNSAAQVVGGPPPAPSAQQSRAPSPSPQAVFMRPSSSQAMTSPSNSGLASVDVAATLRDYGQRLPGERRGSASRPGSSMGRPTSGMGFAGVGSGAASRSASPQPAALAHSPSTTQMRHNSMPLATSPSVSVARHNSMMAPSQAPSQRAPSPQPPSHSPSASFHSQPPSASFQSQTSSFQFQNQGQRMAPPAQAPQRATSPATGIVLDANGRVVHDEMAVRWEREQQQLQQQRQPPSANQRYSGIGMGTGQGQSVQRRPSYIGPGGVAVPPPPPLNAPATSPGYHAPAYQAPGYQAPGYAPPPSQTPGYAPPPSQTPTYGAPPPSQAPGYAPPPSQTPVYAPPPSQTPGYSAPPPSQTPAYAAPPTSQTPGYSRSPSHSQQGSYSSVNGGGRGSYYQPAQSLSRQESQESGLRSWISWQQPQQQQHHSQRQPPPPAPVPAEKPVMFYVKALYDYTSTIPEEFDFQAGDVIAVTSTPEDGWWTGRLLDESRASESEGREVFPSNFVALF